MDTREREEVPTRRLLRTTLAVVAVLVVVVLVTAWIIQPTLHSARIASCHGLRVMQIALPFQNYHAVHGSFPPAFLADEAGRPAHSLRVLMLPYIGYEDLYKRYRFDEPWDGPNNRLLAKEMPVEYRCPAYDGDSDTTTSYVAVVGPSTAWRGPRGLTLDEIEGYSSKLIVLVEIADSNIHWMSPHDMTFEQAIRGVNVDRRTGISSNHPGGVVVGYADGSTRFLRDDISCDELQEQLTIKNEETP